MDRVAISPQYERIAVLLGGEAKALDRYVGARGFDGGVEANSRDGPLEREDIPPRDDESR